ncbi:MAG: ABC-F family ATP-binding cassette domain-containing protein [Eubacteriales bacterium]|nr:ABC-F family ATP-binding cassette domain-containing protein [Eubacteriales bacterium]
MGLVNFNGIVKYFGNRCLINEVSFTVEQGERVALIGPNGSGKTTLIRIAMGIETCDLGGASFSRGTRVGYLMQNFEAFEADQTALYWSEVVNLEQKMRQLEAQMALPSADTDELMAQYARVSAKYESIDGYVVESRLKAILFGLGLKSEALLTPVNLLSSGEKMRVALARILLTSPDLLILDEPTNHLDISATMWLEEYLKSFSGGVLVVSHDRYFLDCIATRIVELNNSSIVTFKGNYSNFLLQQQIRLEYMQKEKARLDREILREKELYTTLRSHRKITAAQSRQKVISKLSEERSALALRKQQGHLGKINTVGLNIAASDHLSAEIAVADHATKYFGENLLFENVSFLIEGGQHVAIVGANGCGKTTLLRMLMGLDEDFSGKCAIGSWVRTGVLDQNTEFDDVSLSAFEQIMADKEQSEVSVRDALSKVGFYGDEIFKPISLLSGGERVRLKLALLMQQNPQCLILDEPTNHLDLPAREAVENAVINFKGTVIAVSHDRYFLNRCAQRIIAFADKHVSTYQGNWDDYLVAIAPPAVEVKPQQRKFQKPTPPAEPKRDRQKELESEIAELEWQKYELEEQLSEATPLSSYQELQKLYERISTLYDEWEKLDD